MKVFIPNDDFQKDLAEEGDYILGLTEAAQGLLGFIEPNITAAGGPWMPRKGHRVLEVVAEDGHVYIVNTDYAGHLIEWGSVNNPPHAPLRRGAQAAGLRVEDDPSP